MDMSNFTAKDDYQVARLRRHLKGLRENQISVALIVLNLAGYEVDMEYLSERYVGEPNASAAKEMLDELDMEAISIWSCSTKDGGFWETWQRDAMKYGELKGSWNTWKSRNNT